MTWGTYGNRLFAFREGRRTRRVDPLAVETSLLHSLGSSWWEDVGRLAAKPGDTLMGLDLQAWEEKHRLHRGRVLPALRAAFEAKPFDERAGTGLTDLEVQAVGEAFRYFCSDLATLARPFRECASHGLPYPRTPTYAEWVGLYLCRRAVSRERNTGTAEAVAVALLALKGAK